MHISRRRLRSRAEALRMKFHVRVHHIAVMMVTLERSDRVESSPMATETTGNEESADQSPTQQ